MSWVACLKIPWVMILETPLVLPELSSKPECTETTY